MHSLPLLQISCLRDSSYTRRDKFVVVVVVKNCLRNVDRLQIENGNTQLNRLFGLDGAC